MKLNWIIPSLLSFVQFTFGNSNEVVKPLSEDDAFALVAAQEQAKETAKTSKEADLQSAPVLETAVADLGDKKVIFNRVPSSRLDLVANGAGTKRTALPIPQDTLGDAVLAPLKPTMCFSISGQVDKNGISDLWWRHEGVTFRIFTNANFLYFVGTGIFEDADYRYSNFLLITSGNHTTKDSEEWVPGPNDFSSDSIEYYIVEWGDSAEPPSEAFAGIEAMLTYYVENEANLKVAYENQQKIAQARADYQKANPPKDRDVIINYRPIN